jgi:hypothetical protein
MKPISKIRTWFWYFVPKYNVFTDHNSVARASFMRTTRTVWTWGCCSGRDWVWTHWRTVTPVPTTCCTIKCRAFCRQCMYVYVFGTVLTTNSFSKFLSIGGSWPLTRENYVDELHLPETRWQLSRYGDDTYILTYILTYLLTYTLTHLLTYLLITYLLVHLLT